MQIESTFGATTTLEAHRGRAVVVFYEAYRHVRDNEALKRACGRLVERDVHGDRLRVLGIANVAGLGALPVRSFVRLAVQAAAAYYGIELWMDWDGALARAPYGLDGGSNVMVLGPDGAVLFRASGPISDHRPFDAALSSALARAGNTELNAGESGRPPASSSARPGAPPRPPTGAGTSAGSRSPR
jgi:hypothetical protein